MCVQRINLTVQLGDMLPVRGDVLRTLFERGMLPLQLFTLPLQSAVLFCKALRHNSPYDSP